MTGRLIHVLIMCCVQIVSNTCSTLELEDVAVVVLSQSDDYHSHLAQRLRYDLLLRREATDHQTPIVHLTHVDFPHFGGGWAVMPLIPELVKMHGDRVKWYVFCEDRTYVDVDALLNHLQRYDSNEDVWMGHGLHDAEATIIHHFAFFNDPTNFKYPNFASGFAISNALMQRTANRLTQRSFTDAEFSIDAAHELAMFLWDNGNGSALQHVPTFCTKKDSNCLAYPRSFQPCGSDVATDAIFFAVKTYDKYHDSRVKVVKKTWGRLTENILYFSNEKDEDIPTINLGIPNTEYGHCAKTMAILKYVYGAVQSTPEIRWIVLADDDTILSVPKLKSVLSCYESTSMVAVGERYGYNVHSPSGYNYITGGGGIIFSRRLLQLLTAPGTCDCPSISSPDDMFLGVCITRLGGAIVHSPLFHQARPNDYAPGYLESSGAVSFHKHWMIDPFAVYNEWFADADRPFLPSKTTALHKEL